MNEITTITKDEVVKYVNTFLTNQLTQNEVSQFVEIATAFQLNPFKREIYCIAYGQGDKRKLSILTGYEVYIKRAERTGKLDGYHVKALRNDKGIIIGAECTINRKDWKFPFVHEVSIAEYRQDTAIWRNKPETMIKKVCIAQAFRLCFSDDLGGVPYTSDELADETPKDVTTPTQETPEKKQTNGNGHKESVDNSPASQDEVQEILIMSNDYVLEKSAKDYFDEIEKGQRTLKKSDLLKIKERLSKMPKKQKTLIENDEKVINAFDVSDEEKQDKELLF